MDFLIFLEFFWIFLDFFGFFEFFWIFMDFYGLFWIFWIFGDFFFWGGGVLVILQYFIEHCFICRPSDSTVSVDAGIEARTVATPALAVRRSIQSARSHPLIFSARSHPQQARSHPLNRLDLIHLSVRSHPLSRLISSTIDQISSARQIYTVGALSIARLCQNLVNCRRNI